MKKFLLLLLLLPFVMMGTASLPGESLESGEADSPDPGTFPIKVDFHTPRNFGFHIGDEIPLTVTFEVRKGVILDLVNLPHPKDIHGLFEVRGMKVGKRLENDRTLYTVSYRLQCFTPALAVNKVNFPPLHIGYATQEDWNPMESKYRYRDLYSQSFEVFFSRTAPFFGAMKELKGPILDKKGAARGEMAMVAGGLMVLAGLISRPWGFLRKRRKTPPELPSLTAKDRALKALQEARENCFTYDDHRKRLYFEVNAILRNFLKEVFALPTANRPALEIIGQLKERPEYEELMDLVERINQVIYEGYPPVDVESIVRQFSGLLQKLDGTRPPAVKDDNPG
jgi:hypothetical protein